MRGERRFERPGRGTDDQGRTGRTETVEQVDGWAGRARTKRGLRLNPQLRRIRAEVRAELTSAEIAMSGSCFDDVVRDSRRCGIENATEEVRRPGDASFPRRELT